MPYGYSFALTDDNIEMITIYAETIIFGTVMHDSMTPLHIETAMADINNYLGTMDKSKLYVLPLDIVHSVVKPMATALIYESQRMRTAGTKPEQSKNVASIRESGTSITFSSNSDNFQSWGSLMGFVSNVGYYANLLNKLKSISWPGKFVVNLEEYVPDDPGV